MADEPGRDKEIRDTFEEATKKWKRRGVYDPKGIEAERRLREATLRLFKDATMLEQFEDVARLFDLKPGSPEYRSALEAWREMQRGKR